MTTNPRRADLDLTPIKVEVKQAFDDAQAASEALFDGIRRDRALHADLQGCTRDEARRVAIAIMGQYFIVEGQARTGTMKCAGVIACSPQTLDLAKAANQAKGDFQLVMSKYSGRQVMCKPPGDPDGESINTPLARVILRELKLGGLLQRQLTRKFAVLDYTPHYFGFTCSKKVRSIKQITTTEAGVLLSRWGNDEGVRKQLEILDSIPADEILAVVIPNPVDHRWNYCYVGPNGVERRKQANTSLPVLYPAGPAVNPPTVRWPKSKPDTGQPADPLDKRVDCDLESDPLLPIIHAYRYKGQWREQKRREYDKKKQEAHQLTCTKSDAAQDAI